MPMRPATPCSVPGCPRPAVSGGRCELHAREHRARQEANRPSAAARGYDARWRRIRAKFLKAHAECVECGAPATVADHIVPLSQGGTNDWDNLQPLCKRCHDRKTATVDGGGRDNLT